MISTKTFSQCWIALYVILSKTNVLFWDFEIPMGENFSNCKYLFQLQDGAYGVYDKTQSEGVLWIFGRLTFSLHPLKMFQNHRCNCVGQNIAIVHDVAYPTNSMSCANLQDNQWTGIY